jgi:hypothetical protein
MMKMSVAVPLKMRSEEMRTAVLKVWTPGPNVRPPISPDTYRGSDGENATASV